MAGLNHVLSSTIDAQLKTIAQKVANQERISFEDGVYLYQHGELGFLGTLANHIREQKHGDKVFFNRNFYLAYQHICLK